MSALEPGGPTIGTWWPGRPRSAREASLRPWPVALTSASGPAYAAIDFSATRPSSAGFVEMTAAMRRSFAATATTCPAEYDVPHSTMRSGSMPGRARAAAIAAW